VVKRSYARNLVAGQSVRRAGVRLPAMALWFLNANALVPKYVGPHQIPSGDTRASDARLVVARNDR
jgi:hypothetical protein